jgi:hypothetical protein
MKTWIESPKKNNSKKKKESLLLSQRDLGQFILKKKKKKKRLNKLFFRTLFIYLFIRNKDSFFKIIIIVNDGVDDENVYELIYI